MKFTTAKQLLDALLEGDRLSASDLDSVLRELEEGQYLDYKDGRITHRAERSKGSATIREYVSAFANAEGGVLIVGVSDRPREVSPCEPPGHATLERWAESLVQPTRRAGRRARTPRLRPTICLVEQAEKD